MEDGQLSRRRADSPCRDRTRGWMIYLVLVAWQVLCECTLLVILIRNKQSTHTMTFMRSDPPLLHVKAALPLSMYTKIKTTCPQKLCDLHKVKQFKQNKKEKRCPLSQGKGKLKIFSDQYFLFFLAQVTCDRCSSLEVTLVDQLTAN